MSDHAIRNGGGRCFGIKPAIMLLTLLAALAGTQYATALGLELPGTYGSFVTDIDFESDSWRDYYRTYSVVGSGESEAAADEYALRLCRRWAPRSSNCAVYERWNATEHGYGRCLAVAVENTDAPDEPAFFYIETGQTAEAAKENALIDCEFSNYRVDFDTGDIVYLGCYIPTSEYAVDLDREGQQGQYEVVYCLTGGAEPEPPEEPEPPADDHADSDTGATNLALGGRQSGRIETAGDIDFFRVQVTQPGILTVYTTGSTDTYGRLYYRRPGQATILLQNDDGGEGTNFRIRQEIYEEDVGSHYVAVSESGDNGTGSYTVHADFEASTEPEPPADDHGDTRADATNLALGGRRSGRIDPVGDKDVFRIQVEQPGALTVYTTGSMDTFGRLRDSSGTALTTNDDGGENFNFRIEQEVDADIYYVEVTDLGDNNTGSYTVHADFEASTEPEPPEEPEETEFCRRPEVIRHAIMRALQDLDLLPSFECRLVIPNVPLDPSTPTGYIVTPEQLARVTKLDIGRIPLDTLPPGVFEGLAGLRELSLSGLGGKLASLPAGVFDGLTSLETLDISSNHLTSLPAGLFNGLDNLRKLFLSRSIFAGVHNEFTSLPAGLFNGLGNLEHLEISYVGLTSLPGGLFAGLANLNRLELEGNELTSLPAGVFDGLGNMGSLDLSDNELTRAGLPAGVFDGLPGVLHLGENQLCDLESGDPIFANRPIGASEWGLLHGQKNYPDCIRPAPSMTPFSARTEQLQFVIMFWLGVDDPAAVTFAMLATLEVLDFRDAGLTELQAGDFDGLTNLRRLELGGNQLTQLPAGLFDGLANLERLTLDGNQLTRLPAGLFDGLANLERLTLNGNQLTELPAGLFDDLAALEDLELHGNHLVGLTGNDPLFAELPSRVNLQLDGQTDARRLAAAAPLMLSASDSMRQGFVRIINESGESGGVRILPVDGGGTAAEPIEIQLGAREALHFNSNDLEGGSANKGIAGVGSPMQGDWRLSVETDLGVRVLSFVRTTDGFLTAMGSVLPRDAEGRLAAQTFNPGSNMNQESKLRLVNTGGSAERVSIEGVDDQGRNAGPVALTLAAGESRTLSALELETGGAQGLTGALGDGAGKWRLFITAGQSVVGVSLLEAVSGHLTNISTMGVGNRARLAAVAVPLMLSASDSMRQGFVRIINESGESGGVRILPVDDGGNAANPIEVQLGANQALHFNSNDLENGNAGKGINAGAGSPMQGDWRLSVETDLGVRVLSYIRTNDGFLTAMHDVLPRDAEGRLAAQTFNPGSNANQVSKLRLVNAGGNAESVGIEGVDDQGNRAGPVLLTLAAGESRTLSAQDLENGAQGLTGTLGDGAGKWRLFIFAGQSVVGVSLLEAVSGHLTNISTMGVATAGTPPTPPPEPVPEPEPVLYGAMARGDDRTTNGLAFGYSVEVRNGVASARERAMEYCRGVADNCRVIGDISGKQSMVLYIGREGGGDSGRIIHYGFDYGDRGGLCESARNECEREAGSGNCRLAVGISADGSAYDPLFRCQYPSMPPSVLH